MRCFLFTLYGNKNFGNKLQNYATQVFFEEYSVELNTIVMRKPFNLDTFLSFVKLVIKNIIPKYRIDIIKEKKRLKKFILFDKLIKKQNYKKRLFNKNTFIIIGSDQTWNSNDYLSRQIVRKVNSLHCTNKISFSTSIASSQINNKYLKQYIKHFNSIKEMSVREDTGKKIIEDLTNRNDIEVLIDPTMLLTIDRWENVMKKPEQYRGEKYILCYFLGNLSDEKKEAINAIAKEKKCKIINLLDKNDLYYSSGPSEFLWLEKNAELICTDSFHSSVFGFLFNRPFVVFKRIGNGNNMYSRIETLISKFKLQNRIFDGNSITKDNLNHDYTESYKILEIEKNKSINFLRKSLYIK